MLRFIDLNYHYHKHFSTPAEVLREHRLSDGYAKSLAKDVDVIMIKHLNYTGQEIINGIPHYFINSRNHFRSISRTTLRRVRALQPDAVLVQGFIFPLQVLALRRTVGKTCHIIIQHHGEKPFTGIKGWLQRMACRRADAFVFTSAGNAAEWISKGIIPNREACVEILEAAPTLQKTDKTAARIITKVRGNPVFISIGRLNFGKDPMTVLRGFALYLASHPAATLYMLYQEDDLLPAINAYLQTDKKLQAAVILTGKVPPEAIANWLSAADYFISGSHKEGSGYALLEAMICGCIPVVTDIPSFTTITKGGQYGKLWKKGDPLALARVLEAPDSGNFSAAIAEYAAKQLSPSRIAEDWLTLLSGLKQQGR